MSPVESVSIVPVPRKYPHVNDIDHFPTSQTIRLLWDRVLTLQEQLIAAQATIDRLITSANQTESTASTALQKAKAALTLSQVPGAVPISPTDGADPAAGGGTGDGGTGGGGGGAGGGDGGGGQIGCSAAGATGHDTGGLLNPIRAGQIVCGTGNEFSALKNPTANLSARQNAVLELLLRMIWHLHQAGFTAGRQRTPSGMIATDTLTVEVDSVQRAYQVFANADAYTEVLQTQMVEVTPASLISDPGLPD